jgi:glutamate/tyrosine decarboxylase-like PLP-dependent enzyme
MRIPERGRDRDEVLARLEAFRSGDVPWRDGRTFAYVYDGGREAAALCAEAYVRYLSENGLDPTAFPSLLRLENEIVGMVGAHLGLPPGGAGSFTSGGTESIFLAVKAARDHARATRPQVTRPQMVLPHTAHASFQKAGHYLDVEPVLVPVDPGTCKADPAALRAAITPATILLVGSAPSYAHGVVDPIGALGALAAEAGLWLHVDACIGGFVLPYFRRLGAPVPPFAFDVPGVTSLSVDLHKYGFAAKGASVLLYRDRALRRHQLYACAHWPGYTVVNSTIQSSRSGGPLAAAWAVLQFVGDDGYLALCRQMLDATRRLADGVRRHPDLRLAAEPESNLVAFGSETVSVFHVVDEMAARGWYVQPQLGFAGAPATIHLSVGPNHAPHVDALLADLSAAVEAARALPSGHLAAFARQALGAFGGGGPGGAGAGAGGGLDEATFGQLLEAVGVAGTRLPERMAPINEVLDALPPDARAELLVSFLNELYRVPERESGDR